MPKCVTAFLFILVLVLPLKIGGWIAHPVYADSTTITTSQATMIGKIIGTGSLSIHGGGPDPSSIPQFDSNSLGFVQGADLGAPTLYNNRWYFVLGDTVGLTTDAFKVLSAPTTTTLDQGIHVDNMLNPQFGGALASKALNDGPADLPNGAFTLTQTGTDYMFAGFMSGGNVGGFTHWSNLTKIAKYNSSSGLFEAYKGSVYVWQRSFSNTLQYAFAQSAFVVDNTGGYLYMIGSPANRFGGVKLARTSISEFLNASGTLGFSYYEGNNVWSDPVVNESTIDSQVVWLIPPNDPNFTFDKDYATAPYPSGQSECTYLTIAEFSVIYNPYLQKYMLMTGSDGCLPSVVHYYLADSLTGPWSAPLTLTMPFTISNPSWDYYGPYVTDSFLVNNGQTMYFIASTWLHYGIYEYSVNFTRTTPSTSTSNSNQNSSSNSPGVCTDQSPGSQAPELSKPISNDSNHILLSFTAADNPVNKYVLEYGTKSGSYLYGVSDMGINSRSQMTFLVGSLSPNMTYYFRVRGGNGCATGPWSNEVSTSTGSLGRINQSNLPSSELDSPKPSESDQPPGQVSPSRASGGYNVKIKVFDTNKKPVEGATVTIHSTPQVTKTDKDGFATFHNVESGDHKVLVAYNGFQGEQSLNLSGDVKEFDLNIQVKPQSPLSSPKVIIIMGVLFLVIITLAALFIREKRRKLK